MLISNQLVKLNKLLIDNKNRWESFDFMTHVYFNVDRFLQEGQRPKSGVRITKTLKGKFKGISITLFILVTLI